MPTHRQAASVRRLLAAAVMVLVVVVGCQAPNDTNGQSGHTTTMAGAGA